MFSRFAVRTALVATITLASSLAHAQTLFSTGFEAPQYSTSATTNITNPYTGTPFTTAPGALVASGQGWFPLWSAAGSLATNFQSATNSSTVQSAVVSSGSQALRVDGLAANQQIFGSGQGLTFGTGGGILDLSFDMRVSDPSLQTGQWGLLLVDTNNNAIASVGFFGGALVAGSGSIPYFGTPLGTLSYDTWANYDLTVNFFTKTMSVALNGVPISSMQDLPLTNEFTFAPTTAFIGLGGQAPAGVPYTTTPEHAYFDNLSAAAAPEPGTLALLVVGGTLVIVRRRQPRK